MRFKKIASVLASTAILGSTIAFASLAAASNYPAPFDSGAVAVVWGTGGATTDLAAAVDIMEDLRGVAVADSTTSTATVTGGDAVSLNSGSDYLYLNDDLGENVQTLTKDDLSTVLADGTFTDDDGTDYDYEQTITIGQSTNVFEFGNSNNDLNDPALMLALSTSTTTPIYTWAVTFDSAVPFNATESEGEAFDIFGKSYTVGTATDSDTLVLLGGSDSRTINVGETVPMEVNGVPYDVTLTGISDSATSPKAGVTVNGDSNTFTEGQTKTLDGIDVYVKTVFRVGDNSGYVEIELGSDRLTLETGKKVAIGSDDTKIDGTLITFTGNVNNLTKMQVAIAAEDNDADYVLAGDSFTDTVFKTLKVEFESVINGPEMSGHNDVATDRKKISVLTGGDRELLLRMTDESGVEKTLPFAYQNATSDDNGKIVHLWEGDGISEEDYFTLNSGTYEWFMQMDDITMDGSTDNDEVSFTDQFTGTSYTEDDTDLDATTGSITLSGQTFTVQKINTTQVRIYSSDYSLQSSTGKVAVYPYMELVSGKDQRVAIVDNVTINYVTVGTIFETPTGNINLTANTTVDTESPGEVDYQVGITAHNATSANITIALDPDQDASSDNSEGEPAILFVEDEDKSESSSDVKNAIIIPTTDEGGYSEATTPVFAGANYDSQTFDDSDFTGYLTDFGTYVLKDGSDNDQTVVSLTYPSSQMYANVYFAEESASISGGTGSGNSNIVSITDSELASASGKNIIVVGGACVNTVAANLLGSSTPLCGADWSDATDVGAGQYLIQTFARTESAGKIATLVAGYNAGDTTNAATALTTQTVDTTAGMKYIGTTASSLEPVITGA